MASNTTLLELLKQDQGTANFHTALNNAFDTIDALCGGANLYPGTAGEAIAQYECVCFDSSGEIVLADGSDEALLNHLAMADAAIANAEAGVVRTRGYFSNGSWTWSGAGAKLYVDASTPGALTETRPTTESPCVGIALGTTTIFFDPYMFRRQTIAQRLGPLSGGEAEFFCPQSRTVEVVRFGILSDTATSSSDGSNNWDFVAQNLTQTQQVANVKTDSDGELVVDGLRFAAAIDNADLDPNDVVEIQVTLTDGGSATDLSSANVYAVMEFELKHF